MRMVVEGIQQQQERGGEVSSYLLMCGGGVRSILLLPLVMAMLCSGCC